MTDLKKIVNQLGEDYQANKAKLSEMTILENALYSISGIDKDEPSKILLIPTDSEYLQSMGSAYGVFGNKIFSYKPLIDFLKNKGVDQFLGITYDPNNDSMYEEQAIGLDAVALPIVGEDIPIFEFLVSNDKGSFECKESKVKDWSVYEAK